ncbi:MAG: molybdenum cofactor biosynthesis protein [Candidatus Brockarchaeota archaeon]|nr:molybdenum cofactor biosynthesis protein [Candidatus Brockarchaeota archaeon]MBO3808769.1 molybdenum cofactor biosynthesis protein [Candidatus Brockarchaeota archaeon]
MAGRMPLLFLIKLITRMLNKHPMKTFRLLVSLDEALQLIYGRINQVEKAEEVNLDDAVGRVSAESVKAPFDVPCFNRSAMDGYCVRAEDVYGASQFNPVRLRLAGTIGVDEEPRRPVGPGECIQVATGSIIPEGGDAVVMYEHTDRVGEEVLVYRPVYPGENISKKGSDIPYGKEVVKQGDYLNASKIGVLAALGIARVRVYEKPRVLIVPTGSELAEVGKGKTAFQIYDVNSHTLAAVVKENGGIPVLHEIVPDDEDAIEKALEKGVENSLIVVTGGSSVGTKDVIYDVLRRRGEVLFHGVQVKPGKPTVGAVFENRVVLAMPGHPTSCLSNAYLFLRPVLRRIARLPDAGLKTVRARLSRRVVSTLGRRFFLTVRLRNGEAEPVFKESSAITSMAEADGYVVIPENADTVEKGDWVEVHLFD